MSRRFALVTVLLVASGSFLVGLIVAGSLTPAPADSRTSRLPAAASGRTAAVTLVNFADIAERINPSVVNIDATSLTPASEDGGTVDKNGYVHPWESPHDRDIAKPRRGTGAGLIIEPDGHILTNDHVIERADRIIVKLSDGRSLKAHVVGSDPDTDIALIKVDGAGPLPAAPLGESSSLRVGEWVCAIGNPLAYEHTVTVGVVSFVGRKLFDLSLDNYIQTDAAINFGNSGGPLINARGEVIGINSAISSRASNIGFAVPINGASSVLPQLRARGKVSRGYMGVGLRDVDQDLERSLKLSVDHGALVQDITAGSPADRAGLRPYDVITSLDDRPIGNDDQLIREIASRAPGSAARLRVLRDGHDQTVVVKLSERPARERAERTDTPVGPAEKSKVDPDALLL